MAVTTRSSTMLGVNALAVDVEAQIVGALRRFVLVGLPDSALREAKERVRCAIENSGYEFPNSEVIVSLAPASLPKMGSGFDLAIAASILSASSQITKPLSRNVYFLGELSLSGEVRAVGGGIASAELISNSGGGTLFTSKQISSELSIYENTRVVGVESLSEMVAILNGYKSPSFEASLQLDSIRTESSDQGFGDVIGQDAAKRAMLIAASGGHHMLMVGSPGVGKSMLAKRIISLLPEPELEEILEITKIHHAAKSILGDQQSNFYSLRTSRPFRSPHHTSSTSALVGGGRLAFPGELSLAHRGVLFLDEFVEMRRDALESLREPLETREVHLSRANSRLSYPANFLLIAAMNPCPRGSCPKFEQTESQNVTNKPNVCRCTGAELSRYRSRLSGPLLDRFDIQVWVPKVPIDSLEQELPIDPTPNMKAAVQKARDAQKDRFKTVMSLNSSMTPSQIKAHCELGGEAKALLSQAAKAFDLSARAFHRILRLSRTIADLEGDTHVSEAHLAEALSFRISLGEFGS